MIPQNVAFLDRSVVIILFTGILMGGLSEPTLAQSQTGAITGTITNAETNAPIPGVNVTVTSVSEETLGAATDGKGQYKIEEVPVGEQIVTASFVGFQNSNKTVQIVAGETTTLNFEMASGAVGLEQVVVTATGERTQREIGASVSTVQATDLAENSASTTISELLQDNVTGVTIQEASGTVGNATNFRIRGNSSISVDNTPLVYIDGTRISTAARARSAGGADSDRMLDIDPSEIESIEIVKGPSAATLYGSEASGGVLRITTKKGMSSGDPQVTVRSRYSSAWDPHDYATRAWNPSVDLNPSYPDITYQINTLKGSANIPNERKYYDPFRNGTQKKAEISLSGGQEEFGYFTQISWNDKEGAFVTNGQEGYSVRANFNFQPAEDLSITSSNAYVSQNTRFNYNDGESWGYVGATLLGPPEFAPIRRSDPSGGGGSMPTCPRAHAEALHAGESLSTTTENLCNFDNTFLGGNNFDRLKTMRNSVELERYIGSITADYIPFSYLTTNISAGYDQYTERGIDMIPNVPLKVRDSDPTRTVTQILNRALTLEGRAQLSYNLSPGLQSQTTFGAQFFREWEEGTIATGTDFPPGAQTVGNSATSSSDESYVESRTLGLFIQEELSYADRLFITPGIRFDNSSSFGEGTDGVFYPKVGISYVISEESWSPELFDDLRVRGAWGQAGKLPGPLDAITLLSAETATNFDGSAVTGFRPERPGNPKLKPERGTEIEAGFDASLLNNRLDVSFTYYDQTTKDALVRRPVSPSTGFGQGRWDNVGEVQNSGVETELETTLMKNDGINWKMRFGYTYLESEITELAEPIAIGGRSLQQHKEGFPFAAYFVPEVRLNENDEVVVGDDPEFQGSPTPNHSGSVSTTISLFDDLVTLYGNLGIQAGQELVNYTEVYMCRTAFNSCAARYERTADGEKTDRAKITSSPKANFRADPHIYDASFAKLRTLSARFSLPKSWTSPLGARSVDLKLVGSNLLTLTDYPGVDPEITDNGRTNGQQKEFLSSGPLRRVSFEVMLRF